MTTAPLSQAVHWSSVKQDYLTPSVVLEAVLKVWDSIDLDPCAEDNTEEWNVPAVTHYTSGEDGLACPWFGNVFCNAPYSQMLHWAKRAVAEANTGKVHVILLTPARPGAEWWRILRDYPVCLVNGRLTFAGAPASAPFPSALWCLSQNRETIFRFVQVFSELGDIWERVSR